jgi:hypothetical protein
MDSPSVTPRRDSEGPPFSLGGPAARDHSASPIQLSGMLLLLPGEDRPHLPPLEVTRFLFEPAEEVKKKIEGISPARDALVL